MPESKRKPKPKKLDFKAPKGHVRVHIFIAIDEDGNTSSYEAVDRDSEEHAVTEAIHNGMNADVVDVYHVDHVFKIPAKRVVKKVSKKTPKKVKEQRPEPSDDVDDA